MGDDNSACFRVDFLEFLKQTDKDKNQQISFKEACDMILKKLKMPETELSIKGWFTAAGVEKSEEITFAEFWKVFENQADKLMDINLHFRFYQFDDGQKGYLTYEECLKVLAKMGWELDSDESKKNALAYIDSKGGVAGGDNKVTIDELREVVGAFWLVYLQLSIRGSCSFDWFLDAATLIDSW